MILACRIQRCTIVQTAPFRITFNSIVVFRGNLVCQHLVRENLESVMNVIIVKECSVSVHGKLGKLNKLKNEYSVQFTGKTANIGAELTELHEYPQHSVDSKNK